MIIYNRTLGEFNNDVTFNMIKNILLNTLREKGLSGGSPSEINSWNNSLHFMKDIPSGSKIGFDDVKVLRTEKILSPGISPEFYETVIGKILVKDAKDGEGVTFSHFFKE